MSTEAVLAGVPIFSLLDDHVYESWCELLTSETNMPLDLPEKPDQLVSVALETVDLSSVALQDLVAYTKREDKELRSYRLKFAEDGGFP